MKFWKSRKIAKYTIEPRDVQMKIMRTHLAAMSGEISNLRTMLEVEFSKAHALMEALQVQTNESHQRLAAQLSVRP